MIRSSYYMTPIQRGKLYRFLLIVSALLSLFFLTTVLSILAQSRIAQESLSESVAPQVLRFHVLANSDSAEDQDLKLEVRQLLLDTIYERIAADTSSLAEPNVLSKEELRNYIANHSDELKQTAETYMQSKGFSYNAEIRFESCYFPTKQYGDITFPCGTYDAVRVLIGEGKGKNWWCVLYPPLCFSGVTSAGAVPDSSKRELENLLADEEYQALSTKRRVVFGDVPSSTQEEAFSGTTVRVRFRLWEMVK